MLFTEAKRKCSLPHFCAEGIQPVSRRISPYHLTSFSTTGILQWEPGLFLTNTSLLHVPRWKQARLILQVLHKWGHQGGELQLKVEITEKSKCALSGRLLPASQQCRPKNSLTRKFYRNAQREISLDNSVTKATVMSLDCQYPAINTQLPLFFKQNAIYYLFSSDSTLFLTFCHGYSFFWPDVRRIGVSSQSSNPMLGNELRTLLNKQRRMARCQWGKLNLGEL